MTDTDIISSRGVLKTRRRAGRDIGVARAVDHAAGQDGLATSLALSHYDRESRPPRRSVRRSPVQHRLDAGLLHEHVRDVLEHLGIERVAQ
jgi:hypothetical protein